MSRSMGSYATEMYGHMEICKGVRFSLDDSSHDFPQTLTEYHWFEFRGLCNNENPDHFQSPLEMGLYRAQMTSEKTYHFRNRSGENKISGVYSSSVWVSDAMDSTLECVGEMHFVSSSHASERLLDAMLCSDAILRC